MSNILTNQIRTSPGPSEIEKELIKRMEGQNFQNASGMIPRDNHRLNSENPDWTKNLDRTRFVFPVCGPDFWSGPCSHDENHKNHSKDNCQNLQQKLIDQKRAEIDRRNKFEEQSRKKKIQVSFGLQVK